MAAQPLLKRLPLSATRASVTFELDGQAVSGYQGDTVLTAVLSLSNTVRHADYSGLPRSGFCLMGACQDCWMQTVDGVRLRACSTPLEAGMRLVTGGAGSKIRDDVA